MFTQKNLKVSLASMLVLGLAACTNPSNSVAENSAGATEANAPSTTYRSGTPVSTSRVTELKVLGAQGERATEEEMLASLADIAEFRTVDSVVQTREGFIELYSGATLIRALKVNNGILEVVYSARGFVPESAHYSFGEQDSRHVSSTLTFGLKSCATDTVTVGTDTSQDKGQDKGQDQSQDQSLDTGKDKTGTPVSAQVACERVTVVLELTSVVSQDQGQDKDQDKGQDKPMMKVAVMKSLSGGQGHDQGQDKDQDKGYDKDQDKDQGKKDSSVPARRGDQGHDQGQGQDKDQDKGHDKDQDKGQDKYDKSPRPNA
jgi:hypothetical protein